jgi:hypothetical protein
MPFTQEGLMSREAGMYDTYFLFTAAQAIAEERLAQAEKESKIHRSHLRTRAETRLQRAVALARRDGLDRGSVARQLATLLDDRTQN